MGDGGIDALPHVHLAPVAGHDSVAVYGEPGIEFGRIEFTGKRSGPGFACAEQGSRRHIHRDQQRAGTLQQLPACDLQFAQLRHFAISVAARLIALMIDI